jgi:hypothetical protein
MPLTPEQIKELLSKATAKPRGAGRRPKNFIDTSDRTVVTWFKLGHKLFDEETGDRAECSNPNCPDTRHTKMVANVDGIRMCRRCFLAGYSAKIEGQVVLGDSDG